MPSPLTIKVYRAIELLVLFLVIALLVAGVWLLRSDFSGQIVLIAGLMSVGVLVCGLFFLQQKIGGWLTESVSQNAFASGEEFTSLYERSPVAYVTITTKGVVTGFNPAAVHLLHATADTFKQVNFYNRILPTDDVDQSVLEGKIVAGITVNDTEVLLQSAEGKPVWVLMSVYTHQDKKFRLISLVDVTQQKIVDTAKTEFVALATHQLRTPIAAIRWNVELLQKNIQPTATEKQIRYLTKIERNVHRMISLINDFLSVSKLEMGTFAANVEVLDISSFLDTVLDEYAEKISEKGIILVRNDTPAHAQIRTDSRLFHIIVSNLLSNAVKYIHTGGTLTLTYTVQNNSVVIVVADTGIGIPEPELERLFTKFFRASNAQTHQTEGTGLGLYVVKQSVEKLKGSITVQSVEEAGTTFTVTLPAAVVSAGEVG